MLVLVARSHPGRYPLAASNKPKSCLDEDNRKTNRSDHDHQSECHTGRQVSILQACRQHEPIVTRVHQRWGSKERDPPPCRRTRPRCQKNRRGQANDWPMRPNDGQHGVSRRRRRTPAISRSRPQTYPHCPISHQSAASHGSGRSGPGSRGCRSCSRYTRPAALFDGQLPLRRDLPLQAEAALAEIGVGCVSPPDEAPRQSVGRRLNRVATDRAAGRAHPSRWAGSGPWRRRRQGRFQWRRLFRS